MNKLTWITAALAALMVALAAVGALCDAVVTKAQEPAFYGEESRAAVKDAMGFVSEEETTAYIGIDAAQQGEFAKTTAAFMAGKTDAQADILSQKEQQHMLDVRKLVNLAQTISKGCMTLCAGLAVVIAWTGAKGKRRGALVGAVLGMLLVGAAALGGYALMNAQGFAALFERFHEIAFTNDLWLMNPQTDILIRMMPQLLFERAGMDVLHLALRSFAVTGVLLAAVYFIVGGMIRRQLTEKEGRK